MKTARDVVLADLAHLAFQLDSDFGKMAGKRLLITGGAGFLGYYLIQTVLDWNRRAPKGDRIDLTVYDNFFRGVPDWLEALTRTDTFSPGRATT